MSRLVCTLFAVLVALPLASAANDSTARPTFELGVAAYRAGDFARAKSLWLSALEAKDASELDQAALDYDLGNACARTGAMLEALGWYGAALRLSPRDSSARKNVEFARSQAKLEPADRGDLTSALEHTFDSLTVAEAGWTSLVASVVFLAALCWEALRGGALARRVAVLAGVFAVFAIVPWVLAVQRERTDLVLVIGSNGAALHSEPRTDAALLETLPVGDRVRRLDALPGWVKVSGAKNDSGWVREEAVFALARNAATR